MSLKKEVLAVVQAEGNSETLLAVVRCHLAQGTPGRQVYDVLEEIWLSYGFDVRDAGGIQDELEYVMERVWYWGEGA